MQHAMSDLDGFRSLEEYATYQEGVRARLKEIDSERPGQPLSPEAQDEFGMLGEIDQEIEARSRELRARRDMLRGLENDERHQDKPGVVTPKTGGGNSQGSVPENLFDLAAYRQRARSIDGLQQAYRDGAQKVAERAWFPHPNVDQDRAKASIQRLIKEPPTAAGVSTTKASDEMSLRILGTGSPEYRDAFAEYIRTGVWPVRAAPLAVVGTTTTGGYAVPYVFDPTIIAIGAHTTINPYRTACRTEQIIGGNDYRLVTATAVTASYKTEAAAESEQGPTFGQPALVVQRASAFATVSYETLEDRPDISTELAVLIQEAKDTLEENQFAVGVGTTVYPFGIATTLAYTAATTATASTFAVGDLTATEAALPLRYRMNAAWFFSRSVIRVIQGWETAYGQLFDSPAYYPMAGPINTNPTGNTGKKLLGYPVWESPSIPTGVTSAGAIVGVLLDPSRYLIVDRVGMNVEVIPNLFGSSQGNLPTGQRGIFALWRNTARPVNADAGRQITIHT
jgi:HK97 family phage major capsid protein